MASDLHVLGEAGVPRWEMKVEEAPLSSSQRGAPTIIIIMHLCYIIILVYGWTVDKKNQRNDRDTNIKLHALTAQYSFLKALPENESLGSKVRGERERGSERLQTSSPELSK